MPWRKETVMSQRSQFILDIKAKAGSFSEICRKYGISRTTGYKWAKRFEEEGLRGLTERSRKPLTSVKQVPYEITTAIIAYRRAHGSWGATTILKVLKKQFKDVPSRRTIHRILQDCNFISTRRMHRRRQVCQDRVVLQAKHCNHVWTVDFKGWWRTTDGKKVFPLTIRDEFSKYVLEVRLLPNSSLDLVKAVFIECFEKYGLPEYIRSDNGSPFSYSYGLCGLSRLSAWWMKLGVVPNFIPLASPQHNGGHERMHRDIAKDLESCPAKNLLQQQYTADLWKDDFNNIRPHSALRDQTPHQVYRKSKCKYKKAEPPLEYPSHMVSRFVNKQGAFKFNGKKIFVTKAIGQENIGLDFTHRDYVDIWFANTLLARAEPTFNQKIQEYNLITGDISVTYQASNM